MGEFSDKIYGRFSGKNKGQEGKIEFECHNCMKIFNFAYKDVMLNKLGDIEFDPEPSCPRCGSSVDIVFSDQGQEKIEDMLTRGKIRKQ